MANPIKIKRSSGSAAPAQLSNGELAFTEAGNVMFIGNFAGNANIPIAGARTPGVLTANQALVTNATNMIDTIMIGNSTINAVANSSSFKISNSTVNSQITLATSAQQAGSYFLHANGSWVLVSSSAPGGSNTWVQFNDSTSLNGTAGFTFDKDTNNAVIANTITAAKANVAGVVIANSTALSPVGNNILLGNSTGLWVVSANTISAVSATIGTNFTANATLANTPALNVVNQTNTATLFVTTSANVGTAFTANSTVVNAIALNVVNQTNTATIYATTTANVGGNVQLTTAALTLGAAAGTAAPSISVANSTGNVQVLSAKVSVANSTSTANLDPMGLIVGTTIVNSSYVQVGGTTVKANSTVISTQDLSVSGNLTITGTLTTVDATNLNVKDSIIFLADQAANQAGFQDILDIGFTGQYGNTTNTLYTGFVRDASATGSIWKLFDAIANTPAPTTTVDFTNTGFSYAILQSWLKCTGNTVGDGSGVFTVNTAGINATANSTWYVNLVANTLSLSTALPMGSGGLGFSTITAGDLVYGNATPSVDKLARGADGYVLQANTTNILWGAIDGGTF